MMKNNLNSIGIRTEPDKVHFAIVDIFQYPYSPLIQHIVIPKSFNMPQKLKYIRTTLLDIFNEYSIEYAGIKVVEDVSKNKSIERINIEGVIQESLASANLNNFLVCNKQNILSKLKKDIEITQTVNEMISSDTLEFVSDWGNLTELQKECVLTAIASTK